MSSGLDTSHEGPILRLTLNRPEKKNALSQELCRDLVNQLESAEHNDRVRAILIEGKGDIFCSGMDLTETSGEDFAQRTAIHESLFTAGSRLTKPIVAAVRGHALGGGVGLVANAHIVIAAHGCNFGLTEVRVGMWPFVIWRSIVAAIGERRTAALALTGRIFSVNEALQWGLVHEVTPAFELEDRAEATVHHLAESSPQAIRLGLGYAVASRDMEATASGRLALEFRQRAFQSADYLEGVAAFLEKRKPEWKG